MMRDWWYGSDGAHMVFGPLFMLFWFIVFAALVALALRALLGDRTTLPPPPRPTPRELLDERFARGEIDFAEYEARKRALGL